MPVKGAIMLLLVVYLFFSNWFDEVYTYREAVLLTVRLFFLIYAVVQVAVGPLMWATAITSIFRASRGLALGVGISGSSMGGLVARSVCHTADIEGGSAWVSRVRHVVPVALMVLPILALIGYPTVAALLEAFSQ